MTYKRGMSKTKFKHVMRFYWQQSWKHELSPEQWVSHTHPENTNKFSNFRDKGFIPREKALHMLDGALDKLVLEKKLTKEHAENMKGMINSPDKENALVAITIMAALKPKKFKRLSKEVEEVKQI